MVDLKKLVSGFLVLAALTSFAAFAFSRIGGGERGGDGTLSVSGD
ncbi:MAG: hypothetical protein G01um101420_344, partial [Parcubacteria group bacterium Gr01-1014_20]